MERDVGAWLEALGVGHYARAFVENNIDFAILAELVETDLKELGVSSLGHRKKLLAGIAALRATAETIAAPAGKSLSGERRQVTILFADLSGFTALSQLLDPEELHELVSNYTEIVDRIVIECGGTVDKHIGDAVMALFGAPVAHGDDPLRAARAALDIHEALRRWSDRLGRLLQAHIGIASGEVVAGAIGRAGGQDYSVLGDSVNLSARLVATAGAGQTLISDEVYRALSGRAECDALGVLQFKGIDAGMRVWGLRSRARSVQGSHRRLHDAAQGASDLRARRGRHRQDPSGRRDAPHRRSAGLCGASRAGAGFRRGQGAGPDPQHRAQPA
jgi:class 3 adenylate cyclase